MRRFDSLEYLYKNSTIIFTNIQFILTIRGDHNEYPSDEIDDNSGRSKMLY